MKNKELLRFLRLLRERMRPDPVERQLFEQSSDWGWWLEDPVSRRPSSNGVRRLSAVDDAANGNSSGDRRS